MAGAGKNERFLSRVPSERVGLPETPGDAAGLHAADESKARCRARGCRRPDLCDEWVCRATPYTVEKPLQLVSVASHNISPF
jgi:hypothetical protein